MQDLSQNNFDEAMSFCIYFKLLDYFVCKYSGRRRIDFLDNLKWMVNNNENLH